MGLRQPNPETLRFKSFSAGNGLHVTLIGRGKSSDILDAKTFHALVSNFGAWIECDSEKSKRLVQTAIPAMGMGLYKFIKIVPGDDA